MRYFPAFMAVEGQRVVIVGDGELAAQKLRLLARTAAEIALVARRPAPALRNLVARTGARLIEAAFEPAHLAGARLVFAASEDVDERRAVAAAATAAGAPVNAVDLPDASSFITPAIVDRDPLVVAIGTEGAAPMLARALRARIESWLPDGMGRVARLAGGLRERAHARIVDPEARRRFWADLFDGRWRRALLAGDAHGADAAFEQALAAADAGRGTGTGRVVLVGAGPGDPDLLTLKAFQALQEADVIVADGLVPDAILDRARRDARRIRLGKTGYGVSTDQRMINRVLVTEAEAGRLVVRLKGGDPFVFGRAAEELAALAEAGIPVDVIPGVTAALACAAAARLPVTQRGQIRQFSLLTGAAKDGELPSDLDWASLARPGHAFAIYMGVRAAPAFATRLIAAGASPSLAAVVVENGGREGERVIATTLSDLREAVEARGVVGPAIIYVGLDWAAAGLQRPPSVEVYPSVAQAWRARDFAYGLYWTAG